MRATALIDRGRQLVAKVTQPRRRVWSAHSRAHLELRDLRPDQLRAFVSALRTLEREPGVRWARVNTPLHRIVIDYGPPQTEQLLIDAVDRLEAELELAGVPFGRQHPERYPGDREPIARTVAELAADVVGLTGSVIMRQLRVPTVPFDVDLAALSSALRNIPGLRKRIEAVLSIPVAEMSFELLTAVSQVLLQGGLGPTAGILHRGLRLRELYVRRHCWHQHEAALCAQPESHLERPRVRTPRPYPTPPGPIERYTDKAVLGSVGAFVSALASTRDPENAAAAIFGGLPRPARYGRDAFAAHFGVRLAREGVVVVEPQALRHLDRIDTLVIDDASIPRQHFDVLDKRLRVLSLPAEEEVIRQLQLDGAGVCVVAARDCAGLDVADIAIGVAVTGAAQPWTADFVCPDVTAANMIIDALGEARAASTHSVYLSMAEVALGIGLALSGMRSQTVRRIMTGADVATVLAMGNGVRLAQRVRRRQPSRPGGSTPWHSLDVDEALERLETTREGLAEETAAARRRPEPPPQSPVVTAARMIAKELANPMTPVLGAAAGLSMLTGSGADAALIGTVLLGNAIMGGAQHYRTERALARLDDHGRHVVHVLRGGQPVELAARDLVAGDVIYLEAGEVVPADCRILEQTALEVDESTLTGESLPVRKDELPSLAATIADRTSMLYDGTSVSAGRVHALVVAVGDETEARRAMASVGTPPPTGVERRLDALTQLTLPLAAGGGLAVGVSGWLRGIRPQELVNTAISLGVAAVPEGLPMLATMAQLAAADRLSAAGALVRNPQAVEALGRVDVVCADKTGTLTVGSIRLELISDGETSQPLDALDPAHREILSVALRASPSSQNGEARLPHRTDRALVEGGERAGVSSHEVEDWKRLRELPFDSSRGFHAGLARHAGDELLSVKGAPEIVLPRCTHWLRDGERTALSPQTAELLNARAETLAERGLRVLAIAERPIDHEGEIDEEHVNELVFRGFAGMADPIRATAADAIKQLQRAGVKVVMLTGDHPGTAERIAGELDILNGHRVVSGAELDDYDDTKLDAVIDDIAVFARVTPAQKVRIVQSLQRIGRVVAMTGDGANDAAAIRLADVGIAVGAKATAAARHTADMIITDERIETIVHAVLEGRALWTSVRDAVALLLGGNLGEIAFTVAGSLIDGRSPLNSRQLLLVNLLTDSLPALAVALRPPTHRRPDELLEEGPDASLGHHLTEDIMWRAGITSTTAFIAHRIARFTGTRGSAGTVGLLALTGTQLGQTLAVGSKSKVVVATGLGSFAVLLGIVQTPVLSHFFGCRPLGPLGLAQAGIATLGGTAAAVIAKAVSVRGHDRGARRRVAAGAPEQRDRESSAVAWPAPAALK